MKTRVFLNEENRFSSMYYGTDDFLDLQVYVQPGCKYVDLEGKHALDSSHVFSNGEFVVKPIERQASYAELRQKEYPSLQDQMDMLWHAMNNGSIPKVEPFFSTIKEVKDRYPKV